MEKLKKSSRNRTNIFYNSELDTKASFTNYFIIFALIIAAIIVFKFFLKIVYP